MAGAEIAYIDESYDSAVFAMSAPIVPTHAWRETFQRLVAYRKHLKASTARRTPSPAGGVSLPCRCRRGCGGHQQCVAASRAIAQRVECSRLQKRSSEQDSQILVIAYEGKEEELRLKERRWRTKAPRPGDRGA